MQTKKRAKPVKFGKALPPRTEKREIPTPSSIEEHPATLPGELIQKHETKKIEMEVSHTHIAEEISEDTVDSQEDMHIDKKDKNMTEDTEDTNEDEKLEKEDEQVVNDTTNEVPQTNADSEDEEEDDKEEEKIEEEESSEEDHTVRSEERTEDEPVFTEPFSKSELVSDSSGWKQLALYFFLIAFVAFLLGLAFIGGVYYAGKSIKLPKLQLPGFTKEATPTKIPIPTATETPAPTPDLSAYSIQILNGSGITGEASKLKTELTSAGFKISNTGNADNSNYTKTQITAGKSVNQAYIGKLEETLKQWYSVGLVSSSTNDPSSSGVVVTIGSSTNK